MASRAARGRNRPGDLQIAAILAATGKLPPIPGTGCSPSGQSLDAALRHLRGGAAQAQWGPYEAAVRRWEQALGCTAPPPLEPGPEGEPVLTAAFTEWLMGIPGWLTVVKGLRRTALLRLAGNGVVPQQAGAALRLLITVATHPASHTSRAPRGAAA